MRTKLFKQITDLSRTTEIQMQNYLNASNICLIFKWTPTRALALFKLHLKKPGGEIIDNIIEYTIEDNDGEISVDMGNYDAGSTIEISFGVLAITAIEQIGVFIIENKLSATKVFPEQKDEFKKLDRQEIWENSFRYKLK